MRNTEHNWGWDESKILLAPNHHTHLNAFSSAQGTWLKGWLGCHPAPNLLPSPGSLCRLCPSENAPFPLSPECPISSPSQAPRSSLSRPNSLAAWHEPAVTLPGATIFMKILPRGVWQVSPKTPRDGPAGSLCGKAHSWGMCSPLHP